MEDGDRGDVARRAEGVSSEPPDPVTVEGTGVVLIGFGEPEGTDPAEVESFLESIFLAGASLEPGAPGGAEARARTLAKARAPGLAETYRDIGGSPLMAQLRAQGELLESELARRGRALPVTVATQFFRPSVAEAVQWACHHDLTSLVAIPTYPVCGQTTTLAALESLACAAREGGLSVAGVTGWHRHPEFSRLWATHVEDLVEELGVSLTDEETLLYFSAHGIPVKYLEIVPYTQYVEEACAAVAAALQVERYVLGYQNHRNRPIAWVQPDNEKLLPSLEAERVIVVPISFLHEQSETLGELDQELAAVATSCGLGFHRVRVPHDDPALIGVLADLAEGALEPARSPILTRCSCRRTDAAWCTHGTVGD